MDQHPNAVAGGTAGAIATIVIAVIAAFVTMGPVVASAATTVVIAAVLFVGAKGFRGVKDKLWKGDSA